MSAGSASDPVEAVGRITAVPTILKLITELTGLRLSLVAEVTDARWLCCAVNDQLGFGLLPRGELALETTLCKEVRHSRRAIMFGNADADPEFAGHPTPAMYKFKSYISVPIYRRDKSYFGNLCALDSRVTDLGEKTLAMFSVFSELIGMQLDLEEAHQETSRALLDEQQTGGLREQFIAVLGHDLRNPLSALTAGIDVLELRHPDGATKQLADRMRRSTVKMTGLVEELMDFARGRLGPGVRLDLREVRDLDSLLHAVAEELGVGTGGAVEVHGSVGGSVFCDRMRIMQVVTNLASNALRHGAPGTAVQIIASRAPGAVTIAVRNEGPPIPPEQLAGIFHPYARGESTQPRSGLGLGLYIVDEITRAHGGTVACVSAGGTTTFSVTLPAAG